MLGPPRGFMVLRITVPRYGHPRLGLGMPLANQNSPMCRASFSSKHFPSFGYSLGDNMLGVILQMNF